jgi:uncharacterized DUF497 family protein
VGDAWNAFRTATRTTNESEHAATDAAAGLSWWNSMTEPERAQALKAAGWNKRLHVLVYQRRGAGIWVISFRKASSKEARNYGKAKTID